MDPKRQLTQIYETPWAIDRHSNAWATIRRAAAGDIVIEAAAAARPQSQKSGTVAVIPVMGPITARQNFLWAAFGWPAADELTAQFRSAVGDPSVDAIVFDFDSPGGTVDGIPELAAEIRAARGQKPIYASANSMAASAAYWLASQCDKVFVTPSGAVGSIGVFAEHHDLSAAYEAVGEKVTLITSDISPFKAEGNEYAPLSDEARTNIQGQVDTFAQMFIKDVAKGRGTPVDSVRGGYGQGRVLLAADALTAGMVDGVETRDNVIRLASRAGTAIRRQAAAAAFTYDIQAGPVSDLPFSDRLALVSAAVGGLVEHARKRADMRAKEGRQPFSDEDRDELLTLAGSLTTVAAVSEREPLPTPPEPTPTPPAWADHARIQLALARAEFGFD